MVKREGEGKERGRRRDVCVEEDDDKKGFSWTPLLLLLMMIGPGLIPAMEYIFVLFSGPKNLPPDQFRKKLVEFYKKYNPAKLHKKGYLEKLISKYQENQEHLFQNLEIKYKQDPDVKFLGLRKNELVWATCLALIIGASLVFVFFYYKRKLQPRKKGQERRSTEKVS